MVDIPNPCVVWSTLMKRYVSLAFLFFAPVLLHAQYTLTQIGYRNDANSFTQPEAPIVGNGGVAYWHDAGAGADGGERILSYPGGVVAADTRTISVAGDFPVGIPQDTYNGKLLVQGRYFEPFGGGYSILSTLVEYPGGADLVTPFSAFPDGIPSNDSIQIGQGLYDSDGSVVFGLRQVQSPNVLFTAIARYSAGSITILAKSGETPMPGVTNTFTGVGPYFSTGGGTTFFYGVGASKSGLYQLTGGIITKVLENGDPWPAGTGTVNLLSGAFSMSFANEGQNVAVALTDSFGAVFKRINGTWSLVAKDGDLIPNGNGVFFNMAAPSIHGGKVMFYGFRSNPFALPLQLGIYVESAGGYAPVVDLNANFGGITVASMLVTSVGGRYWDGQNVGFNVSDSGPSTRANYLAVPGATTTNNLRIGTFDLQGAGGTPRLTFQTSNGISYHIEESSNLVNWASVTQFAGDGSVKTVTNLLLTGQRKFYRVATP